MNLKIPNTIEAIRDLPSFAGVYMYLLHGKPLYIGKSVHVKLRLLSHFENAAVDRKEAGFVEKADTLEFIQTDSEFRALLLESKLIQTHHPKYNVRWRDDKSYLYIKITAKEEFPKVFSVRREHDKKALYFGPFSSRRVVNEILTAIRRIFPYCTQTKIGKHPCFYSKIGLCAPCPNGITTKEDKRLYRYHIKQIIRTLRGESIEVQKSLYKQLKDLTDKQKYEEALLLRNRIYRFEQIFARRLFGREEELEYNQSEQSTKALVELLHHYFSDITSLHRIECYDVSNLAQKQATASMVVFTDGQLDRGEYRKFKIRRPKTLSDFDMMVETITRRMHNKWPLPDLMVIDGGKPQLRKIQELRSKNYVLSKIPIIGIAKNPDRLVICIPPYPTIRPRLNNRGFNMIQHLRDEAHRFARKYHLYLRERSLGSLV